MFPRKNILSIVLPILIAAPTILSAKVLNNKQLAGPPVEFELMKQAQAEKSALTSKTALIPVNLQESKSGNWYWDSKIAVDNQDFSFLVFANGSKNWQIELVNPLTKQVKNITDLADKHTATKYGLEQNTYPSEKYTFSDMDTGNWTIKVKTIGEPDQFEGFILVSSSSKYQLSSYKTNLDQIVDHKIHFVTQTTTNEDTIEILKDFNPINSAFMLVTAPSGSQQKVSMYDDGQHGDKLASDGLYGGDFKALESGGYTVQINAYGNNPNGTPFYRTSEHFVPVIEQKITLSTAKANAFSISDNRLNIAMNVENKSTSSDDRYRIIAEVWGQSQSNKSMQPVSWISTITDVTKGQLNIELDARWIAMANVGGNFELRNVRIEDSENFIPLISAKSMDLKIAALPKAASKAFNGEITQEMMMGKMPEEKAVNKAGPRLLLVHGYCSSDVWGPFAGQFSSSATFYDLEQNRSHDDFARRIRSFGSQFSSFGVVSHSQGGAASLHLYTYYWSGLDYSSGSRMIQSVGTPYSGTPLAGILAAIGDVFGVGCGRNSNLTTSGASSWLAGIPTWARNQVNYYTTSFSTKWWRYDYCSLATDLFLSDPEDGVTEKSRGQLSGGINRGHKKGWCHTLDMRDSGQTSDSSRNSTMSAYARR
jgi:hypothetical protein